MEKMEKGMFWGKKAFVAGGTKGTGLLIAGSLLNQGAFVTVAGRSFEKTSLADGENLEFIAADFSEGNMDFLRNSPIEHAIREADILVICAGPFVYKKLHETTLEDWLLVSQTDYAVPGAMVSLCLPHQMQQGWGRIILFGGTRTEAVRGYRNNGAYAGAKTGLSVLTKSVAMEYGSKGITCNAILPGFTRNAPSQEFLIQEEELCSKAMFLMEHPELNGVLLNVDKGWNP